jgi:uncharacterized small protein (DUF1192 family)
MSGETEEEARAPSRAGSMASSMFSGRTAESSYATEALSAEMKAELVNIILYRKMTGTMRESRTLVRSVNACQRAEAALLLVEVATSALDEIAEGDIPQGSVGQKDEMMFLQEIQQRDSKLLEMNVRCEEAEALRHEAENTILEMSVRCEEAEALRQEAENAVLEMSVRCEEAEKLRSECEHVLKLGAEQEERIALLQAEIARMQKERMESTADDAKDLAGNLRKEILDLQAKYQQACESACALQSRLESIQGIHESVGCQNEGDIQRGFARLQELEKSEQSIQECFTSFECKSVEEMRNVVIALKAERDVQETLLETFRKQYEEAINSASAAHAKCVEQREESSNFEDGVDLSPAKGAREKARRSINGVAVRIKADLTTSILNNADKERSRRSYEALGLMETTAEGDDVKEEDQKRLALIELDDAAMEATLTKVQKAADEKTGKHFTFRTEEMLLLHLQSILEAAVPLRDVLLGALNEVTIEEAILALQSRYEYVRDEISGTQAASKLPFAARLSKMKSQDQKILMTAVETAFCKVSSNFQIRCAQKPRDAVAGKTVLQEARTLPEAGWYYMIAASECVVQTTWKNMANAFDDILKYMKCMEEACHGSIKLIGEQWAECVDRFERTYGPINTEMIRTLGKLTVIDNPKTSFIKDDKSYLVSTREYDDGFSDFKSAKEQVEVVWKKLETRELSGTDKQKTSHLLKPKNWRTLINATKDREKDKGVKIDYVKVASVVEYSAYNALFGQDIPRSRDHRCRWCNTFHKPDVNCGPTLETKLKSKEEIEKLVQNVSIMTKILEKAQDKRSGEEDKKLTEFIKRANEIATRLQAPSAKSHDGKAKFLPNRVPADCHHWTRTGRCHANDKGNCRFNHDEAKKGDGKARDSTDADSGPDGKSAPMCALKECNKPCPWDAKGGKYWKFCTPAHNQKAKEKDQHVACPASIISVHDPQMHAEQILAGTSAYVTQVVPPTSWAPEGLMAQAAELAQTIFDEDALADIDWGEADDVEELGTVILFAAFEQVSGRMTTTMDQQNIALAWKPGLLSAHDVAEIYTGTQAQEIAWLYNALVEAVRARCARMQQEKASQIELERICEWDKIRMGQDLGTKMEITRIAEEDRIECQVYGVLCEMIEQIVTQVAPAEEKSHEVVVRLQTYAEQAWEALKVERERKTKAAVAHAAMLKAHSEARERKIREKHERQMCRELVLAIVSDVSNCVEACEPRDVLGSSLQREEQKLEVPNVGHNPSTKPKRKRIPGWQTPDPAWMRRRLQDEMPRPSRYLADGGVWRRMRRRLYRFMYARMKRSARKHLTVTRFPTVAWDPSSGDDPPRCDRIDVTTEADGATTWRDLLPTEVARPRKRARLHDSASISVGACDPSEGAQGERTRQGELSRPVNVTVQDHWFAPHILSSYMSLSSVTTRHLQFDAEKQEYINMPASEAIEFLASYNVRVSEVMPGLILILYDTGCTVFISSLADHFCVEITCDAAINGIGKRSVKIAGPVAISFLDDKAQNYVTYESPRGFYMEDLNFGIFPSGQAEKIGWEFHVRELNPYFIADGHHVPLIKDHQTGLTWMAERRFAPPTVAAKQRFIRSFAQDDSARIFPDRIGVPEICPKYPDTKENIDRHLNSAGISSFGQYHCAARPPVVRGGSRQVAIQDVMVGTRSQSAKKTETLSDEQRDKRAKSDVVVHDQPESDANGNGKNGNEKQESTEQNAQDSEDQEIGNRNLPLVTENGLRDLDMEIVKSSKSDEEMLTKAKVVAASKMKMRQVKVPAARFFNVGESEEVAAWHRYYHQLAVHLESATVWEGVKLADGAEVLKGLELLKMVEGRHTPACACDECLRYKSKLSPIPDGRTDRPRRTERVKKLYLDPSGKLSTPSIYHNFQYYVLGVTDEGYMIVFGMTFRDQVLFVIGRMFDSLGGAPLAVQVDPAGELNSKVAESYFTHRETRVDVTQASEHWRNGRPERRHSLVKGCTRCTLAHANAPLEFWFLCLSHVVFTLNLLLRSRDSDTKEIKDMTVWEAHFGRKPNLNRYLIGPWGCLAYIVLTKEQRDKRGMDRSWGPRALAGIYVGCVMNHKEGAYEFLVHDGMRIRSTTANLKIVGDCFPFKYQQRRDLDLVIAPRIEEVEDDDEGLIANTGSVAEEPKSASALSYEGVEDLANEAARGHDQELKRIFAFVGRENAEAGENLKKRIARSKGQGRALLKSKKKVHESIARNSTAGKKDPNEYLVEVEESREQVAILDPRDFKLPAAPADFKFELPYQGARYKIAEPVDFSTGQEMSVTAKNPHERYVGRKVRKAFRIRRKVRGKATTVWQSFEGVVRAYDAKRAVFDILYEDKDEEEVDFLELGDILIMGKEFGDKDEHKGLTRAEVTAQMGEEALIAAVAEEAMASHGRTSYGEDRPERRVTFEDKMLPCAHVGTKTSFPLPACDCRICLSGSTGDGAASGERQWRSRPDVKKEQAFGKWVYDESDSEKCECTPGVRMRHLQVLLHLPGR